MPSHRRIYIRQKHCLSAETHATSLELPSPPPPLSPPLPPSPPPHRDVSTPSPPLGVYSHLGIPTPSLLTVSPPRYDVTTPSPPPSPSSRTESHTPSPPPFPSPPTSRSCSSYSSFGKVVAEEGPLPPRQTNFNFIDVLTVQVDDPPINGTGFRPIVPPANDSLLLTTVEPHCDRGRRRAAKRSVHFSDTVIVEEIEADDFEWDAVDSDNAVNEQIVADKLGQPMPRHVGDPGNSFPTLNARETVTQVEPVYATVRKRNSPAKDYLHRPKVEPGPTIPSTMMMSQSLYQPPLGHHHHPLPQHADHDRDHVTGEGSVGFRPFRPQHRGSVRNFRQKTEEWANGYKGELCPELAAKQLEILEARYGGRVTAHTAATIIQRSWRDFVLRRQFSQVLNFAKSVENLSSASAVKPALAVYSNAGSNGLKSPNDNIHGGPAARMIHNRRPQRRVNNNSNSSSNMISEEVNSKTVSRSASLRDNEPHRRSGSWSGVSKQAALNSIEPGLVGIQQEDAVQCRCGDVRCSQVLPPAVADASKDSSKTLKPSNSWSQQGKCQISPPTDSRPKTAAELQNKVNLAKESDHHKDREIAKLQYGQTLQSISPEASPVPPCPPLRGEEFYSHDIPTNPYSTRDSLYSGHSNGSNAIFARDSLYCSVRRPRRLLGFGKNLDSQAPKPPLRTVSFLGSGKDAQASEKNAGPSCHRPELRPASHSESSLMKNRCLSQRQAPIIMPPPASAAVDQPNHLRSKSSPADQAHQKLASLASRQSGVNGQHQHWNSLPDPSYPVAAPRSSLQVNGHGSSGGTSPLPPPPYVPPPPLSTRNPKEPLPSPPSLARPINDQSDSEFADPKQSVMTGENEMKGDQRPGVSSHPCDSVSSIDSGFRSSCSDSTSSASTEAGSVSPTSPGPRLLVPEDPEEGHEDEELDANDGVGKSDSEVDNCQAGKINDISEEDDMYSYWVSSPTYLTSPETANLYRNALSTNPHVVEHNSIPFYQQTFAPCHGVCPPPVQMPPTSQCCCGYSHPQPAAGIYETYQDIYGYMSHQPNYRPAPKGVENVPQQHQHPYHQQGKQPQSQAVTSLASTPSYASSPATGKKTVRIQLPDESTPSSGKSGGAPSSTKTEDDEVIRRRNYRVGLNIFNTNPERGIDYLARKGFIQMAPASVAKFLVGRKGLSKRIVGEYICNLQKTFNLAVLNCLVFDMDFSGLHLDIALRHLVAEVHIPGEAQKIEKLVEVFARRYIECNQMFVSGFRSPDTIFVLGYAMILLNTDLHNASIKPERKMKQDDFIRNLRGIDAGSDVDADMLRGIYDRIRVSEFKPGPDHVSQVSKVDATITGKSRPKLNVAWRRLVCFCRVTEVADMHRKDKASVVSVVRRGASSSSSGNSFKEAAHQRGLFLFNDLLVVTKADKSSSVVSSKRKKNSSAAGSNGAVSTHAHRYSLGLADLRVTMFRTEAHQFGVQLQERHTNKVAATFACRSYNDQQRFVADLQESIAEVEEMERVRVFM